MRETVLHVQKKKKKGRRCEGGKNESNLSNKSFPLYDDKAMH